MTAHDALPGMNRWSSQQRPLPADLRDLLLAFIGPGVPLRIPPVSRCPQPGLDSAQCAQLRARDARVSIDDAERLQAVRGMALLDVVGARDVRAPDAVVWPRNSAAVQAVIDWCVQEQVAIVPAGGRTSVVGGLVGPAGVWISLDLGDLQSIGAPSAGMVRAQPGVTGPQLEEALARHGHMFGHFPQSWERATLGGYAATNSAGQNSAGYGRIRDLIVAAQLATPIGPWSVGSIPATSVGPDLLQYVIGSEGTLGVFTELTLRTRPLPDIQFAEGALAADWESGLAAVQALATQGWAPAVLRFSDEQETLVTFRTSPKLLRQYAQVRGRREGCLLVLDWHGTQASVVAQRHEGWRILRKHRVIPLGKAVGRGWRHRRFDGPYLRDQLIDCGYFVETFETAAPWDRVTEVIERVRTELRTLCPNAFVMTHVSHVYATGASMYFTVVDTGELLHSWRSVKHSITSRLRSMRVTVSHHHGVGVDHAPWMADELGPISMQVVRAVKATLDPTNIMNPALLDHTT